MIIFHINMVRRSVGNFANALVQQYQSIYLIALGANSVQVGLVNSLACATIIAGAVLTTMPETLKMKREILDNSLKFISGAYVYVL